MSDMIATTSNVGENKKTGYGHLNSRFFKKLPTELRLKIYREVFSGSKANAELDIAYLPPVFFLEPSDHHRLLLACRQIYEEAWSTYWSETTVVVGYSGRRNGNGLRSIVELIPAEARPLIKEMHGIQVFEAPLEYDHQPRDRREHMWREHMWRELLKQYEGMHVQDFLGHFKNLTVVRLACLTEKMQYVRYAQEGEGEDDDPDNEVPFELREYFDYALFGLGFRPSELVDRAKPKPHKVTLPQKAYYGENGMLEDQHLFINHTTGKAFLTHQDQGSDEENFQRVS